MKTEVFLIAKSLFSIFLFILLLKISIKDIQSLTIDDNHILLGVTASLVALPTLRYLNAQPYFYKVIGDQFIASVSALILMLTISLISQQLLQILSLGHGDAKLALLGGTWLGLKGILIAISFAFVTAGTHNLIQLINGKLKRRQPIAFAPYLSLGIFGVWILGTDFILNKWNVLWHG